jgi:hypothetical protein
MGLPTLSSLGIGKPAHTPLILILAERSGVDVQLRELKRVAGRGATKQELDEFQAIIAAITVQTKLENGMAALSTS